MMKSPATELTVLLCDASNTENLTRLNLHLRAEGVGAVRASRGKEPAAIFVPAAQVDRARKLRAAWLKSPTDLMSDYAKVRAKRPKEPLTV